MLLALTDTTDAIRTWEQFIPESLIISFDTVFEGIFTCLWVGV